MKSKNTSLAATVPLILASLIIFAGEQAQAAFFNYEGTITSCDPDFCDPYTALAVGSAVEATIEISVIANGSFTGSDILEADVTILNPAAPISADFLMPETLNPVQQVIPNTVGDITGGGTTDSTKQLQ